MGKWLTPDEPPDNQFFTRRLLVPASLDLIGIVDGLLLDLTRPYNWEQFGSMTPDDTAALFNAVYDEWTSDYQEPPDAESADDLDGEPELPWYEQVYDWVIAGFLAISFTPQAAIIYQATVPKLRVAFRTGNIGALFRVLINGVEMLTGDTYGASVDVAEYTIDASAITPPYTVRIEHNGSGENIPEGTAAKLEYIRMESVVQMVQTILRADPTGCGVQWSLDNGDTWETIDLATCITGLANDAIAAAIADGTLGGGQTQQPAGEGPLAGGCYTYHVHLDGGHTWHSPVPVNDNWTITISNARGGWSVGELAWYCPDGSRYLLGTCDDSLKTNLETDVLLTAYHMQLIGRLETPDIFFDPMGSGYTVPADTGETDFYIAGNTGLTGTQDGAVDFDVTVCQPGWTHTWDFTESNGDWSLTGCGSCFGGYTLGQGWVATNNGEYNNVNIHKTFASRNIISIDATIVRSINEGAGIQDEFSNAWYSPFGTSTTKPAGTLHLVWTGDTAMTEICIYSNLGTNLGASSRITALTIQGQGTDPF